MHIPDGFLSTPIWITLDFAAAGTAGWLARRATTEVDESKIPLLGVMGAFVFAAQMINFPVAPGTSNHLVGGALLAYALGPWAASLVMVAILAIQAFVFQDGGIMALGANTINMALAGVWAATIPYRRFGASRTGIFVGAWLSVMVSGCLALTELLLSGVPIPSALVAASSGVFCVSALIEGAITVAVLQAIERINPGWVRKPVGERNRAAGVFLSTAVVLVVFGVLIASAAPDGLERLAERAGVAHQATTVYKTALADYQIAGFESIWLRKAAAGIAGLAAIYGLCLAIGALLRKRPLADDVVAAGAPELT
ncbi:MAG TPA: energy-coupling factor ABC transporter permease [Bryobacteraceae bacterium]|jgi:cobalt/nickel transport system permease protein